MPQRIGSLCNVPTPTETRLQQYLDAETKILGGQEFRLSTGGVDRTLRLADLVEIRTQISLLQRQVAGEQRAACGRNSSFVQADFG